MYRIVLFYQSNENGIYTTERETATDLYWANMKRNRMLNRWLDILCPHIDFECYYRQLRILNVIDIDMLHEETEKLKYDLKYDLIQQKIKKLNELDKKEDSIPREFEIVVETD